MNPLYKGLSLFDTTNENVELLSPLLRISLSLFPVTDIKSYPCILESNFREGGNTEKNLKNSVT